MHYSISERCERAYDTVMIFVLVYRKRGRRGNGNRTCDRLWLLGLLGRLTVRLLGIRRREESRREDFR
jgi:hypothetical protein